MFHHLHWVQGTSYDRAYLPASSQLFPTYQDLEKDRGKSSVGLD